MRQLHLAALTVFTLAGCASAPVAPGATAMTSDTLVKLASHRVVDTFGVIGKPDREERSASGTFYTWQAKVMGTTWVPTPAMTSGFITKMPDGVERTGSSGQTYDKEVICHVRIDAGPTGLIQHLDFNGPRSACDPVSHRLAAWANAA